MKLLQTIHPIFFLIVATMLEVCGDSLVRMGIFRYTGLTRGAVMIAGAVLLFGYGFSLNLAPVKFGQVVGLYIATLFVVWQIMNYLFFHTAPTLPILIGGAFVIFGGLLITFWHGK